VPRIFYPITGLDRPLGLYEVETPRIYRRSAHRGGKVDSPTHRRNLANNIGGGGGGGAKRLLVLGTLIYEGIKSERRRRLV
jgi:hypothetical protein